MPIQWNMKALAHKELHKSLHKVSKQVGFAHRMEVSESEPENLTADFEKYSRELALVRHHAKLQATSSSTSRQQTRPDGAGLLYTAPKLW